MTNEQSAKVDSLTGAIEKDAKEIMDKNLVSIFEMETFLKTNYDKILDNARQHRDWEKLYEDFEDMHRRLLSLGSRTN